MKAARLHNKSESLRIEEINNPEMRPGSVIIRVESAFVPPYMAEMLSSDFVPPLPFTPGFDGIGIVEEVAPDVRGLRVGEKVYCNQAYQSPGDFMSEDLAFLGNFGYQENSAAMLKEWPNGAYAERMLLPAQCLVPLKGAARFDAALLTRLGWLGTAYGAFANANLQAGHTVVINGATGLLGSSAVVLALAMNARRVVAVGHNKAVLQALKEIDKDRVAIVCLDSFSDEDTEQAIIHATDGGANIVLDAAANTSSPVSTMAALASLQRGGTMVLVSESGLTLPIPSSMLVIKEISIMGSIWFSQSEAEKLIALIDTGALDINLFQATTYPLEEINQAIKAAANGRRGLHHTAFVN